MELAGDQKCSSHELHLVVHANYPGTKSTPLAVSKTNKLFFASLRALGWFRGLGLTRVLPGSSRSHLGSNWRLRCVLK
jgi:hypothetical protein